MEEFIDKQIMSFNKKKYNLMTEHKEILNKYPFLVCVIIKDNKIYEIKYRETKIRHLYDRTKYIDIIFTYFLSKYNCYFMIPGLISLTTSLKLNFIFSTRVVDG